MVVTAISPHDAWRKPMQRLVDTVVGVAVGVEASWIRCESPGERPPWRGLVPGLRARLKDRSHRGHRTHRPAAESPAQSSGVFRPDPTGFWPRRQRSLTAL